MSQPKTSLLMPFPASIWLWSLVQAPARGSFLMLATCLLFFIHLPTRDPVSFVQFDVHRPVCVFLRLHLQRQFSRIAAIAIGQQLC